MKTKWNLGLLYRSMSDPKIMRDVKTMEKAYTEFANKYSKNKKYLDDKNELKKALLDYEKLFGLKNPLIYLKLLVDLDSENKKAEALSNKISQLLTKSINKIIFFKLLLGTIPIKIQKEILEDKNLKKYHYLLSRIFITSKYRLSEQEEKILNLKSLPASDLWIDGQEKVVAKQVINFDGRDMSIGEAINRLSDYPTDERRNLHSLIMKKLQSISDFTESEINAIVTDKKIDDELRGYKHPYSETIIGYQNDEKSILNLVKSVSNNFKISNRFYKVKARMLGLDRLTYADRSASVGETTKKVSFDEGLSIVKSAFRKLGPKYIGILEKYLMNGQIDVFPQKGKTGGAYCWSNTNSPTFVLLNYSENLDSVSTFAHEMGHAIHGELSKSQDVIYQGHTISVAEVASTLFENFAFEKILETLSEKEKIIALHDRIQDDIGTIFRQIALFNFETELHNTIRRKGAMSKDEIAKLMNKHMKAYLGDNFDLEIDDGFFFVFWSHIRRFFYVYSYAYGQLISKALYKNYKKDKKFFTKIEKFLSAGGSMTPENIWKSIGIDTNNPKFFTDGLKSIEEDIIRLEKLLRK